MIINDQFYRVGQIDGKWWVIKGTARHLPAIDEKEARQMLDILRAGESGICSGCNSNNYIIAAIKANRSIK